MRTERKYGANMRTERKYANGRSGLLYGETRFGVQVAARSHPAVHAANPRFGPDAGSRFDSRATVLKLAGELLRVATAALVRVAGDREDAFLWLSDHRERVDDASKG